MTKDTTPLTPEPVLTSGEVAHLFAVDPKTVTRWAQEGRLRTFRTVGGQRRFYASEIRDLLLARDIQAHAAKETVTVAVETATGEHQRTNHSLAWSATVVAHRECGRLINVFKLHPGADAETMAKGLAELIGAEYVPAGGGQQ